MSKNPKQVFGGYKSALTKKITSATTYVQSQREFSDRVEAKIDRMITEIRDQMSRWETKFLNDITDALEANDVTEFQTILDTEDEKAEKCIEDLENYLKTLKDAASGGSNQAETGGAQAVPTKIDHSFRPEILQMSFTLEEFNDWSDKFKTYFDHNKKMLDRSDTVSYTHLTLPTNREV